MANMLPVEAHQRCRKLLGEAAEVSEYGYWTKEQIARCVSDSYIEAAKLTKALETIEMVDLVANTAQYTLSANIGQIIRVQYDGRKIYNITKWELDRTEHDWENQTGYISDYITSQQNNRTIRLYKIPETGGGLVVSGGEYGVVVQIDDGVETYTFDSEYGEIADTSGTSWDNNFVGEYGVVTITGGAGDTLEVWATKHPGSWGLYSSTGSTIQNFAANMELPQWCHMGVIFRAAAKALTTYGEQKNPALAAAYNAIAGDYEKLLRGFVRNRSGERMTAMGRPKTRRKPQPWDEEISA